MPVLLHVVVAVCIIYLQPHPGLELSQGLSWPFTSSDVMGSLLKARHADSCSLANSPSLHRFSAEKLVVWTWLKNDIEIVRMYGTWLYWSTLLLYHTCTDAGLSVTLLDMHITADARSPRFLLRMCPFATSCASVSSRVTSTLHTHWLSCTCTVRLHSCYFDSGLSTVGFAFQFFGGKYCLEKIHLSIPKSDSCEVCVVSYEQQTWWNSPEQLSSKLILSSHLSISLWVTNQQ